jgi:hypothetical protein
MENSSVAAIQELARLRVEQAQQRRSRGIERLGKKAPFVYDFFISNRSKYL